MVAISLVGVVMAVGVIVRVRSGQGHGTLEDVLAAAASVVHTLPPVTPAAGPPTPEGASQDPGESGTSAVPPAPPVSPPRRG